MSKHILAFDFGASSGRAILGTLDGLTLNLKEIHRFSNTPIEDDGISWDIKTLLSEIKHSLKLAGEEYEIASIGIDTWGVDFGLIGRDGQLIDNPVHYRDKRTDGMVAELKEYLSEEELYDLTGNQIMAINTIFQLMYLQKNTETLDQVETMLLMPDLFNYLLTGIKSSETTIASTTQLFDPYHKEWNEGLIGRITKEISEELEIPEIPVISVCAHDTASAVVSIPTQEKDFLFISSGTWSLIGSELERPIINDKSYGYNITNESGINGSTRFLKNITGLWLIQETKRQFEKEGRAYSFSDLEKLALGAEPFKCFIDPEDPAFQDPGDMPTRIQEYAQRTNQPVPETDGEIIRCIYESLALKYKSVFEEIMDCVGKNYETVNIVGGGIQASLLSQMIADASGLKVVAGPVEATAIGNIMTQLIAIGEVENVFQARKIIKNTFDIKVYYPENHQAWETQIKRRKSNVEENT